jgi:hypothetical protein
MRPPKRRKGAHRQVIDRYQEGIWREGHALSTALLWELGVGARYCLRLRMWPGQLESGLAQSALSGTYILDGQGQGELTDKHANLRVAIPRAFPDAANGRCQAHSLHKCEEPPDHLGAPEGEPTRAARCQGDTDARRGGVGRLIASGRALWRATGNGHLLKVHPPQSTPSPRSCTSTRCQGWNPSERASNQSARAGVRGGTERNERISYPSRRT